MNIEINYSAAKEKAFDGLEAALQFASKIEGGFHCWVDGSLFIDCVKNDFTGNFETELF